MLHVLEPPTDFDSNHLVVDVSHRALVVQALAGQVAPRLRVETVAEDRPLGLALLKLDGVPELAATIENERPGAIARLRDRLLGAYRPLDPVLATLREWFAEEYGGWVPTIGKHRFVSGIVGLPQSRPMGAGHPRPAAASEWRIPGGGAGRGVRVGVLDTGLYPHPELAGHYLATADDLYRPPDTAPAPLWAGHAVFVAGLIVAQAPAAELVVRRVLADTGRASAWDTARALVGFAGTGLDLLNVSLGCRTTDGAPPLVLQRAIERLGPEVVVVAAAGNHGYTDYATAPIWPAALPGVLAVGATDHTAGRAAPAGFSPHLPWVGATAPGVDVASTYLSATVHLTDPEADPPAEPGDPVPQVPTPFAGYARWSGTSFAAASASGRIAARTVPGQVPARQALVELVESGDPVLARHAWPS